MNPDTTDEVYLRHCLEALDSLPTLPVIALEVMKRALNPAASLEDLAGLIELDPPLTAMVFKVANTPHDGHPGNITSLKAALSKIGYPVLRGSP